MSPPADAAVPVPSSSSPASPAPVSTAAPTHSSSVLSGSPSSYSVLSLLNYSSNLLFRSSTDPSLISRVLRLLPHLKSRIDFPSLLEFSSQNDRFQEFGKQIEILKKSHNTQMNINESKQETDKKSAADESAVSTSTVIALSPSLIEFPLSSPLPELEFYFDLLLIAFSYSLDAIEFAATQSRVSIDKLQSLNRRTLDWISSKILFYYSLTHERLDDSTKPFSAIRPSLLVYYRTACLQHNEPGQAALINAILRNYLFYNLYSQADTIRLKSNFPENSRSQSQLARFLFYSGIIEAVQLHYSDALNFLQEAIRKAPQADSNSSAVGFRQRCQKSLICVQLLMGEIPSREVFHQADIKKSLAPYETLALAVKSGDLHSFQDCMKANRESFLADQTYSMIIRLRHNVIKAGLRSINVSYSRITLKEIAKKLSMVESSSASDLSAAVEDLQFILAKAIHDGVIEGKLISVNAGGDLALVSNREADIYSTAEPQVAFNKRIEFSMAGFNESVKSLTFPPNAHKSIAQFLDEEDDDDDGAAAAATKKAAEREEKERKEEEKKNGKK